MKYSEIKMPADASIRVNLNEVRYFADDGEAYSRDGKVYAHSARLCGRVTFRNVECTDRVLANVFIRRAEFNEALAGLDTSSVVDIRCRVESVGERVSGVTGNTYVGAEVCAECGHRIVVVQKGEDDWLGGRTLPTMLKEQSAPTMKV